jgi:hypothetical protein
VPLTDTSARPATATSDFASIGSSVPASAYSSVPHRDPPVNRVQRHPFAHSRAIGNPALPRPETTKLVPAFAGTRGSGTMAS